MKQSILPTVLKLLFSISFDVYISQLIRLLARQVKLMTLIIEIKFYLLNF